MRGTLIHLEPVDGLPLFTRPTPADEIVAACDGGQPHVPHPPTADGLRAQADEMARVAFPRAEVSRLLADYSRAIGAPAEAVANAERLAEPSSLVVATGQQPCAAGGPLFVAYKALTAVRLAREAEDALGRPVVPVFWNASEDHDIDEVASAAAPGAGDRISPFRADLEPWRGRPIAVVGPDARWQGPVREWIGSLIATTATAEHPDTAGAFLPRPDESWAGWFSRVLAEMAGRHGLVVMEPQPLRRLCGPIFSRAVKRWREVDELLGRSRADQKGGGVFGPLEGPPLFLEHDGFRRRILARGGGFVLRNADIELPAADLASLAEREPHCFSSHAVLRPLVQSSLLPVVAQVLGPGEIAYQEELYHYHASPVGAGRRMPVVWPRTSATLMSARCDRIAGRFGLAPVDLFRPAAELAERVVPKGALAEKVRETGRAAVAALDGLGPDALAVDATLERPFRKTRDTVSRAFEKFGGKLAAAEARSAGLGPEKLEQLEAWVRPGGKPQERVFGTVTAALLGGKDVFDRILEEMDVFDRRHVLIRIAERTD
jgi:bacillithiol biosynthesis cysteine-adding enzyme BshC